jgi:protein-disulfide isomerase
MPIDMARSTTTPPSPGDTASKKQQRRASKRDNDAFSREMAVVRMAQRRRRRIRNRIVLVLSLVVVVALVAAGTGFFLWKRADDALAGPKNMRSDGILLTGNGTKIAATTTAAIPPHGTAVATDAATRAPSGVVPIDLYLDYGQPSSARFGAANAKQLSNWVTQGLITLEIHPVALSSAHGRYSARAANAMACVAAAAPDSYLAASDALLSAAAKKGFGHPSDAGIATLVRKAGVRSSEVASCITGESYAAWVTAATRRATTAKLPDTKVGELTTAPLALVNGTRYPGEVADAGAFATFTEGVAEAIEESAAAASGGGAAG